MLQKYNDTSTRLPSLRSQLTSPEQEAGLILSTNSGTNSGSISKWKYNYKSKWNS